MSKPNSRKDEILSLSFPAGSLEKIIDYAEKHNLITVEVNHPR